MPEVREHRQFGRRYMLVNLLSVLPFVSLLVFAWRRAATHGADVWMWAAGAAFAVGAVFGLWWQARRARRMACPQCGTLLLRTTRPAPNEPIHFVCTRCDVEWVTGLVGASD